jgi:hypothetical protein
LGVALLALGLAGQTLHLLAAGPTAESEEAWRTSPFHGVPNAATGKPIPCVCRYREREFRVGEKACIAVPSGSYTARCDLAQNNTSWVPTGEPCTVSWRSRPLSTPAIEPAEASRKS